MLNKDPRHDSRDHPRKADYDARLNGASAAKGTPQRRNSMRLKDRVAIVTGANSGIGREIADCFANQGAMVVVVARNEARTYQTVEEIKAAGGKAVGYQVDVSQQEQTRELMDKVAAQYGRIDILVNNAGITRYRPFATMTGEDWDLVLAV